MSPLLRPPRVGTAHLKRDVNPQINDSPYTYMFTIIISLYRNAITECLEKHFCQMIEIQLMIRSLFLTQVEVE